MKASDLFVRCLENEGVKYIFGIPGEENLDFLNSLKDSSIKLVLTRHEQAAGFMAATYGRLTGKTGVCLSTLGPGATNFFTSAAYAQLGGMPALMITGQKPIHSSKQGRFQIIDVVKMMHPITKYTKQITHGNLIPSMTREAFRIAEEERPGAVHLELPEDIATEKTDILPFEVQKVRRPDANEKAVKLAVERIQKAKSPLILVGAGANRKLVSKMLLLFLEKTGIPFFNTQMGKGVVPEDSELYLGTAALSDHDYLHCSIEKADLIINIGHDVVEKPPFFMKRNGRQVIHINYFSNNIDSIYFPQLEIVGDIANALWQITEKITPNPKWNFDYFFRMKKFLQEHIQKAAQDDRFPILPQHLVSEVRKVMPRDGIVSLDNGIYKLWFARNYPAYEPNTLLLDNALATMGAGLPSAIATKLVFPKRKVLVVCGDGGFMMNSQELETAVRLKLDLVIMVLNDNAYGMIKWKQKGMTFDKFGLDFGNPDFVKYAESYGATGHRVLKTDDLKKTLKDAFSSGGVHLIEIPIDYSLNHQYLNKDLKLKTCIL